MRTVDPELWSRNVIKPKNILASFTCKRRAGTIEILLRNSFRDAMKEFWANTSLSGRRYLQINEQNKLIRVIYMVILAALLLCVAAVTELIWERALEAPPVTITALSSPHGLHHIDFPAVALCSNNLISRTALRNYSIYLNKREGNRTYSVAQIERNLRHLGALLDMNGADVDVGFTKFLREVDPERNITNLMFKLSPRCMELFVSCRWLGYNVPCEQLFAVRLTPHGFCCAFNSRYQLEDMNTPAKKVNLVGKDLGLSVIIKENNEDFAYRRRATDGIGVLIWNGKEYPVSEGGPVAVLSAGRNASVFIALKASVQYADQSLQYITENWRGCRLPKHEHAAVKQQSYGWCLLKCREMAVQALCSCTPHTMQVLYPLRDHQPRAICSLDHLSCIYKHRENFLHHKTSASGSPQTGQDYESALDCWHCLPNCARTRYSAELQYSSYHYVDKLARNIFMNAKNFVNTSFIHVYFDTYEQKEFLAETTLRWHEVHAIMSSIWMCIAGSLLFIFFELVFHCTVRWRRNYVRHRNMLAAQRRLWTSLDPYSRF